MTARCRRRWPRSAGRSVARRKNSRRSRTCWPDAVRLAARDRRPGHRARPSPTRPPPSPPVRRSRTGRRTRSTAAALLDHDALRLLAAAERYDAASRPLQRAQALEAAAAEFARAGDRAARRGPRSPAPSRPTPPSARPRTSPGCAPRRGKERARGSPIAPAGRRPSRSRRRHRGQDQRPGGGRHPGMPPLSGSRQGVGSFRSEHTASPPAPGPAGRSAHNR